ncbi:hypothetical protein RJZ57_004987 [Blastomyces gilchristii]
MSSVCKEHFLRRSGVKMPVFMRFFTATFGREFPDSGRNSRGMAIKFYTGEGNYDIVGGLDVIRSQSWNSQNFLLDYNPVFDLLANTLEGSSSLEMKLSCMSDVDPDYLECDLWSTIEKGEQISWAAHVQKMNPEEADPAKLWFTPFGVTKVWPRKRFPIPVNCPFMTQSYSSLNFDGQMRVDANHAMNPHYAPNSFRNKFRPDAAETMYQTADNHVGRKSHFYHEGLNTNSPASFYYRVVTSKGRDNLHRNTADVLRLVDYPVIQNKYLAQLYLMDPEYAKGVYDLLPEKKFDFLEVKSVGAEKVGKESRFLPSSRSGRVLRMPTAAGYSG